MSPRIVVVLITCQDPGKHSLEDHTTHMTNNYEQG